MSLIFLNEQLEVVKHRHYKIRIIYFDIVWVFSVLECFINFICAGLKKGLKALKEHSTFFENRLIFQLPKS